MSDHVLAAQVRLLAERHPFYRRRWAEAGVTPGDVRGPADLARLPVTTKQDFLADPEAFRIAVPDDFPVEERALAYLIYTTGTTSGLPAPLYVTTSDDWDFLVHARACAEMLGLHSGDVIANLFPLTPFPMGARIRADRTAAAVGAAVLQGHAGRAYPGHPVHRRTDEVIDLVAAGGATVLWGVSGYVRRLLIRAAERGIKLPSVRWCFITGEATSEAGMASLRQWLGAVGAPHARVANRYGSTEGWSMITCPEGEAAGDSGWHNPTPGLIHVEVADPDGRPLDDGETGNLLITHLRARGTALVRYAVGDRVSLTHEPCPHCGRTSARIFQPTRTGDLVKVNGTLVNLSALAGALIGMPGIAEYRVVIDHRQPGDELSGDVIAVEMAPVEGADPDEPAQRVREQIQRLTQITPQVRTVRADDIYDPAAEAKPRRLIDRRKSA